jgi:hypothetical protein
MGAMGVNATMRSVLDDFDDMEREDEGEIVFLFQGTGCEFYVAQKRLRLISV